MTSEAPVIGGRYALGAQESRLGPAVRFEGHDQHLDRPVGIWLIEAPAGDPAREDVLALARRVATSPHPAFLRVLDVEVDDQRAAVILEHAAATDDPLTPLALLTAGEAVESATLTGLAPARLRAHDLVVTGPDEVRLDPLRIYLGRPREEGPAALLAALLLEHADDDDAIASLAERWQYEDGNLGTLVAELRDVLNAPPLPAGVAPSGPYVELEPTVLLSPDAVAASTATAISTAAPARRVTGRYARSTMRRGGIRWGVIIPAGGAIVAVALAVGGVLATYDFGDRGGPAAVAEPGSTSTPASISPQPQPGQVTVGLVAQEDSNVRVTVDDIVEFDGVMSAGEKRTWEGSRYIQVRTDKGKTMLLSVNGTDRGEYSPSQGHPEWNTIDFKFWPGS